MRRNTFLRSMAALAATAGLPLSALAATNIKMMIPANPGGGWDTTGRALGKALQDAKVADTVTYDNKGDPNAMMVMGAVMLGGIINGKPQVSLSAATPLARLTSEYNVFVLTASSPFKTMKDVIDQLKKDPGSVKWGGGSRGATEHIAAAMIAREVGVDPAKINYVAFRGGGEATAAILGGNVTIGGSGYSEFSEYINAGKMRALAVTSGNRLKGVNVPTLKEQGINVEIGNWRGVYGARPSCATRSRSGRAVPWCSCSAPCPWRCWLWCWRYWCCHACLKSLRWLWLDVTTVPLAARIPGFAGLAPVAIGSFSPVSRTGRGIMGALSLLKPPAR